MRKLSSKLLAAILLSATFVMIVDPVYAAFLQEKSSSRDHSKGHSNNRRPNNSSRPAANSHRPAARPGRGTVSAHRPGKPGVGYRPPVYRPQRPVHFNRRPIYTYHYHAYRPYHWGPTWHPLGFVAAALAATAVIVAVNNEQYHYDNGVYYAPASNGYQVVPAPIGAVVNTLPEGYATIPVSGGGSYFYYGGDYYVQTVANSYRVVDPPMGVVVTNLPDGAQETTVEGNRYMVYNGTYYQPVTENGQNGYEVVDVEEQ